MDQTIKIQGARTHNLKNISLELPKNKMIVFTGVSGSGKSSLAFDTIYAEGQRRYVESLSSYARQFLGMMEKPDVDSIEGLSPAISIDQKTTSYNPRSTVGTVTEIYDYMRVFFARIGTPFCPNDGTEITAKSSDQIVQTILLAPLESKIQILSPVIRERKGNHQKLLQYLTRRGFVYAIVDGEKVSLEEEEIVLDKNKKHSIDIAIDRIILQADSEDTRFRLADAVEIAVQESEGLVKVLVDDQETIYSTKYSCPLCGFSLPELHPRLFSFNLPEGACSTCNGLGSELLPSKELVLDMEKSILDDGIKMITDFEGSKWFKGFFEALSEKYNFKLKTPLKDLPQGALDIILNGTGEDSINVSLKGKSSTFEFNKPFEGILPMILRRYLQTESDTARNYYTQFMRQERCHDCGGARLKKEILSIKVQDKSIYDITKSTLKETSLWFRSLELSETQKHISQKLVSEIRSRLEFLEDVGLEYLTIHRRSDSLSGGEMQRIRLATQIGTKLTGVLYVLDEPSIGLHQKDNDRLIQTLIQLKELGNTLIIVEHDEQIIQMADFVVDIGKNAGIYGGEILAAGSLESVLSNKESLTTAYLTGAKKIPVPKERRKGSGLALKLKGVSTNNLKSVDASFPLSKFIAVTGVSGSGKSSLVRETLLPAVSETLGLVSKEDVARFKKLEGAENIDSIISIDQKPIGKTPRSNPSTYVNLFGHIRDIYASTQESKVRGYAAGRFSFNVKGGRCEACTGDGIKKIEMHFLADVYVPCEVCGGKRYNKETLDIFYKGKNIHEVLEMSIIEAYEFFSSHSTIKRILQTLVDVGLDYLKLGQNSTTLSGGEAQRIKLSRELAKRSTGKTLYILDEPTTGLHFADIHRLVDVLDRLVDKGNTVIVIEHNLDMIKVADHIIDIGPTGGDSGGTIVAQGTPEEIVKVKESFTGHYLKPLLKP